MMVLVDTPIWSLAVRRSRAVASPEMTELAELIRNGQAAIIGSIRQELLSGIRSPKQFLLLRNHLRDFPDLEVSSYDHELAADYYNRCRAAGIQGSNTDFLMCAVAERRKQSVFTTDKDFAIYAQVVPVVLHEFNT